MLSPKMPLQHLHLCSAIDADQVIRKHRLLRRDRRCGFAHRPFGRGYVGEGSVDIEDQPGQFGPRNLMVTDASGCDICHQRQQLSCRGFFGHINLLRAVQGYRSVVETAALKYQLALLVDEI
jgi:hypothetical protein